MSGAGRAALTDRIPGLLRERAFRRYWTGQAVSLFGDQISLIVIPLTAVLVLHADAAQMGWLTTAGLLPALLFSLPVGGWVDRRATRRLMIIADLGRALLTASLPAAYGLGVLGLTQLYVAAFAVGALSVLFDVCDATLFVSLVPVSAYVQGNSLVNGSRAMSYVAGPSVGGFLIQLFAAPFALLLDAASYLFSACCLSRIAPVEPPAAHSGKGHLTAGLRWIARHRVIRASLAASATVNFFNFVFNTLFALYAVESLRLRPGVLGAVLGAGAVGGVLGSLLTGRVVRRIGIGRAVVLGFVAFPAPLILVPLATGPTPFVLALLFAAEFGSGFGVMVLDIALGSLSAAVIPDALRSRVKGAYRMLNHGIRPLGAVVGGILGTQLGLRPTLWIATVGGLLAVLWLIPSPVPRLRELPAPQMSGSPGPVPPHDDSDPVRQG